MYMLVAQSWGHTDMTLCDPMDCSPPGSSVHGILQARARKKTLDIDLSGCLSVRSLRCMQSTLDLESEQLASS